MRYFIDEEFVDDGKTIDLISIGIVAEDGRELYLQSTEFDAEKASPWVQDHVFPHLTLCKYPSGTSPELLQDVNLRIARELNIHTQFPDPYQPERQYCYWRTREQIKAEILAFMDVEEYGKPELWSWCGAYDFVAFCQFFGTMMDLPPGYPHYMRDLQQVLDERGISDEELPEQEEGLHNALHDARHLKRLWGYIVRNDCWQ